MTPRAPLLAIDIGGSSVKLGLRRELADAPPRLEPLGILPHDRPAPEELARAVAGSVAVALSSTRGERSRPAGFALSLPGPVEKGRLLCSDRLGWRELDAGPIFAAAIGAPALRVCSDVDTLEAWLDHPTCPPSSSRLELLLGSGVGGLLIADGIVRRRRGLGHTPIAPGRSRPSCPSCPSCGEPCLDSTLSAEGLLRAAQREGLELTDARQLDELIRRAPDSSEAHRIAAIFDQAIQGLESARATLGVERVRLAGGVAGSRALREALGRHRLAIDVLPEPRDVPWRGLLMLGPSESESDAAASRR